MDTVIELTLHGDGYSGDNLQEILNTSFTKIKEVENDSTSYYPGQGNAYDLNSNNGGYFPVNPHLMKQLEYSIPFYALTNGEFNIGLFRTINLWKQQAEKDTLPSKSALLDSLGQHTPLDIQLDLEKQEVFLPPGLEIDLGGIAKGYSLDVVFDYFKTTNLKSGLINAGGNIMAYGSPEGKDAFTIGIQDPEDAALILGTIPLKHHMAIATSGSYNRYYKIGGVKYSHILSGTTGIPATRYKSVTVLTRTGIESDLLSTVLFLLTIEEGKQLLDDLGKNVEVLYVTKDNKLIKTEGFPITYEKNLPYSIE